MGENFSAGRAGTRWRCGDRTLDLRSVHIMGILNVTPDSFSDGGLYADPDAAAARAHAMAEEGAEIIDVGGESTRPGAAPASEEEELRRVMPVIERLAGSGLSISVDTSKAAVARAALEAGVRIVNDVTALRGDPAMASVVKEFGAGVVLMHMQGTPRTMQEKPTYDDVVGDIVDFLERRRVEARRAGIADEQIVFDPGIGFGKTVDHNLEILRRMGEFQRLGRPLLIGPSRKRFIGAILGTDVDDRLEGTGAAVVAAVLAGAAIVRVHDVKPMARMARMAEALRRGAS